MRTLTMSILIVGSPFVLRTHLGLDIPLASGGQTGDGTSEREPYTLKIPLGQRSNTAIGHVSPIR